MFASSGNHFSTLVTLNIFEADFNARAYNGYTALMFACHFGSVDAADYLIGRNCSIDIQDKV